MVDFLRVGFGIASMRPDCGRGPLAGDPQHPNILGYVWTAVGLPPKHPKLLGYRMPGAEMEFPPEHQRVEIDFRNYV